MIIFYGSEKLKKIFNSADKLVRKYGDRCAELIMQRLYEIDASANLAQLRSFQGNRLHQLKGGRKGTYSLDLKHPFRLIIKPHYNKKPEKPDGSLDETQITEVIIDGVEDTHDGKVKR